VSDLETARALLFREARLLDRREWAAWAELYREDAVYWIPAWRDEDRLVDNPLAQVSLAYHDSRVGLLERIARIESRKSITALPLPRTTHLVGNVEVVGAGPDRLECESSFTVHVYDPRTGREHTRHGHYAHILSREADDWMIARKVITLNNDRVPAVLDFYSV